MAKDPTVKEVIDVVVYFMTVLMLIFGLYTLCSAVPRSY